MILTVPLLSKGSFLGSLINKCRQVVRIKPVNTLETNIKPNISTSMTSTPSTTATVTSSASNEQKINRSVPVAKFSLKSPPYVAKTLEEKAGLPPKPKKPLTPYFRYMNDERRKLLAANSRLPLTEMVKQIAQKWENVDASMKQRLLEEYKKDQEKYIEILTKYESKLTDEQRSQLKQLKQQQTEMKEKRMMRKRIKQLGRPKRPASGFIRFIANERILSPQSAKETYREWHRKAADKWTEMSDDQKKPFLAETRKEFEVYKKEVSTWEEQMIRLGNIDVVRHGNLIDPPEPKSKKH